MKCKNKKKERKKDAYILIKWINYSETVELQTQQTATTVKHL